MRVSSSVKSLLFLPNWCNKRSMNSSRSSPVVAALSLLLIVLTSAAISKSEEKTRGFRIGVIQSLGGIAAEYGKGLTQILELAADDINTESSVKIELSMEDDQTDPNKAVSAFQSLILKKVDVVIGSSWDFVTNAIIPLAARSKVVLFNVSVMPEALDINLGGGYVFANAQTIDQEAQPLITYLKLHSVKTAVIAYANNRWGESMLAAHRRVLMDAGVRVLDEIKPSAIDANEWGALIPRIGRQNPELMLLLLNKNDIDIFLRRAREQKFSPLFYTSNNSFDGMKQTSDKSLYNGICFSYPFERLERMKDVAKRYEAKYHESPRWYADNAYDAVQLLHKAFVASVNNKMTLREALERADYSGIAGRYQFKDRASFSVGGLSLVCISDDALRPAVAR